MNFKKIYFVSFGNTAIDLSIKYIKTNQPNKPKLHVLPPLVDYEYEHVLVGRKVVMTLKVVINEGVGS